MTRHGRNHTYWPHLYDLTELFGTRSFDLTETSRTLLSVGLKIADADAGALILLDKKGRIQKRTLHELDADEVGGEGGLLDQILETAAADEPWILDGELPDADGASTLVLPLRAHLRSSHPDEDERRRFPAASIQKLLGAMYLERSDEPFDETRFEALGDYVSHAAGVLVRAELYNLATVDPLTGCYSRKEFEHNLEVEMTVAEHTDCPLALMLIDIDGFRELCVRYGYRWGDGTLELVAKQVRQNLRETDIIFRYGGGKYVLVMPYTDAEGAEVVGEKLRSAVREGLNLDGIPITLSTGIAVFPHHADRKEDLVRKADQALYQAEADGGDRGRVWNRSIPRYALRTDKLIGIITGDEVRDYRNVSMLLDTIVVVNAIDEREEMLSAIIDMMVDLTAADRGILFARSDEDEAWEVEIAQDDHKRPIQVRPSRFAPILDKSSRQPLFILDGEPEGDEELTRLFEDQNLHLMIVLPLRVKDRSVGTIYLDRVGRDREIIESDLIFLQALAREIGIAIENARLYAENVESREKVESLARELAEKVKAQKNELAEARVRMTEAERALGTKYNYDRIIGKSDAMQQVFHLIDKVTDSAIPVLIQGESGTGKELVAQCIHYNGPRKKKRFVSVNCAAIAESLLESELFGHVKGAFTGANRNKKGLFEQADGGTIFLDEIQDMSPGMQRELLRVLQEGEIRPVGGKEIRSVDVRVISATNSNLPKLMQEGEFREDLYYRLNVVRIELPPLRERTVDIPLLVENHLREIADRTGSEPLDVEKGAYRRMMQYPWPGNVRELQNFLERTALMAEGDTIRAEDIILDGSLSEEPDEAEGDLLFFDLPYKEAKERYMEAYIRNALAETGGNVTQAAKNADIVRSSFHKIMRKYDVDASEYSD